MFGGRGDYESQECFGVFGAGAGKVWGEGGVCGCGRGLYVCGIGGAGEADWIGVGGDFRAGEAGSGVYGEGG